VNPNLYDLLDVDPSASTDEIRAAWKSAIADLGPTDRRFRVYNQAAETLLDPARRREYDAELAAHETEQSAHDAGLAGAADSVATDQPASDPPPRQGAEELSPASGTAITEPGDRRVVPAWLLIALAVLLVLVGTATAYLASQPSEAAVESATSSARTAAETAIEPLLSYDYRTLDQDKRDAERYLTPRYRAQYDKLFSVIAQNAPSTKTVVKVEVIDSAIVRAGDTRAQILLFVNRPTTNKIHTTPVVYKDQVTVTMQQVGGEWLVDGLTTSPVSQ
jgi:Mce-associated membrane protein